MENPVDATNRSTLRHKIVLSLFKWPSILAKNLAKDRLTSSFLSFNVKYAQISPSVSLGGLALVLGSIIPDRPSTQFRWQWWDTPVNQPIFFHSSFSLFSFLFFFFFRILIAEKNKREITEKNNERKQEM